MPIYEYVCRACGGELEKLQRFSDEPLRECPECGEDGLVKKVSASGFRLKGGGWYVTDFRDGDGKGKSDKKEDKEGEGKAKTDKSADKGTDKGKDAKKETSGSEKQESKKATSAKSA